MSFLAHLLPTKETRECFLTLALTDELVRAAVSRITDSTVTVLGTGESAITPEHNILAAADLAITQAERQMNEKLTVKDVVFALPHYYLAETQVKPEYAETLKTLSRELDLKPRGFIEYPSALSYYLEREEGSPPTLLLIAVMGTRLIVTLLRLGNVQQQIELTSTGSFSTDFATALLQVSADILPSRILLFDSGRKSDFPATSDVDTSLESIREELLRFSWHKHTQFLHTPKIEILTSQQVLTALIEACASSFVRELPHMKGPIPDGSESEGTLATASGEQSETPPQTDEKEHIEHSHHHETHHSHGHHRPSHTPAFDATPDEQQSAGQIRSEPVDDSQESSSSGWRFRLPAVSFPGSFPRFPSFLRRAFVLLPLVLAVAGTGFLYWYIPASTLLLIVYPLSSSQTTDVLFATAAEQSGDNASAIPVRELAKEVQGTMTAVTTGKGTVGEKAKGEVTVYNKATSTKTLPKGTVFYHGDLRFTLDSDVTIASASDTGEGLTFGKITARVTAGAIGPQSNVPAGSVLTVKDFPDSSYAAKAAKEFDGGTSREVISVSKEDQTKLEEQLTRQLLTQSRQEISQIIEPGEKLVEETLQTESISKKFSHDAGSEAKELTLNLSILVKARSYREEELSRLAQTMFPAPPEGFAQSPRAVTAAVETITYEKNGAIKAHVRITAYFLPAVDTQTTRQEVAGKSFDQIKTYANQLPHIGGIKILHQQTLPGMENRLPFRKDNVLVQTVVY